MDRSSHIQILRNQSPVKLSSTLYRPGFGLGWDDTEGLGRYEGFGFVLSTDGSDATEKLNMIIGISQNSFSNNFRQKGLEDRQVVKKEGKK